MSVAVGYHYKTPELDRISCKSATFLMNFTINCNENLPLLL